jgi:hypothetical protein
MPEAVAGAVKGMLLVDNGGANQPARMVFTEFAESPILARRARLAQFSGRERDTVRLVRSMPRRDVIARIEGFVGLVG